MAAKLWQVGQSGDPKLLLAAKSVATKGMTLMLLGMALLQMMCSSTSSGSLIDTSSGRIW
jgi:hypothetical protein